MTRLPIERLGPGDAAALADLAASVGWRDTSADWRAALAAGEVAGVRFGGAPVATASRFDFGAVWSIGKVIVHPAHQGMGHARRLLEHLLAAERASETHVTLVATPQGEPVYRRLGFRTVGAVQKLMGAVAGDAVNGVEALDGRRLDAALALDREVFGGDRSALLSSRVRASSRALALEEGGELTGYGVAIEQGGCEVIGPVIAGDDREALRLVRALLTREARPRRIDVPSRHAWLVDRLVALGFRRADVRPVMSLGGTSPPGEIARRFALAAQAFG